MSDLRYTATVVFIAILTVLCWLVVGGRMYVRGMMVNKLDIGDLLLFLTLCVFTVLTGVYWEMMRLGLGKHTSDVPEDHHIHYRVVYYIAEMSYAISSFLIKTSIASLLLPFTRERWSRLVVITTTSFYLFYGVVFMLVVIFQCWPVPYFWDQTNYQGQCLDQHIFVIFVFCHATISLITDGVFAILPIFLVWNLHLPLRTKISVGFVLSLGLSTAAVNMARFWFIGNLEQPDFLYAEYPIVLLSYLEIGIGILAASLAVYRPLIRTLYSRAASFAAKSPVFRSTKSTTTWNIGSNEADEEPHGFTQTAYRPALRTSPTTQSIEEWNGIVKSSLTTRLDVP